MASGDEDAFTELYGRHRGGVYRFALQMTGSASTADDVTQEVFLALVRNTGGYDANRGALAGYLYGMARNFVLRAAARFSGSGAPLDEDYPARQPDVLGELSRREEVKALRRAVLSLPAHYREAVVLCDLHEMDYAEAARVLDCAVGTVRSRLHRARAMLLQKLDGQGTGNGHGRSTR